MKYLTIILLLSSCSAQNLLQRAIKKDPSIIDTVRVETVDTVWMEVKRIDTLFKFKVDTVEFIKDSVRVKYFYVYEDSLVYLEVKCPDCPEITRTITETNTAILKPGLKDKALWSLIGAGLLAFIIGSGLIIKNIFR